MPYRLDQDDVAVDVPLQNSRQSLPQQRLLFQVKLDSARSKELFNRAWEWRDVLESKINPAKVNRFAGFPYQNRKNRDGAMHTILLRNATQDVKLNKQLCRASSCNDDTSVHSPTTNKIE